MSSSGSIAKQDAATASSHFLDFYVLFGRVDPTPTRTSAHRAEREGLSDLGKTMGYLRSNHWPSIDDSDVSKAIGGVSGLQDSLQEMLGPRYVFGTAPPGLLVHLTAAYAGLNALRGDVGLPKWPKLPALQ